MATGTVKWFNAQKGFGFIQPDGSGRHMFVHISAVEKAGIRDLNEGDKVSFDVVANKGKESAENLPQGLASAPSIKLWARRPVAAAWFCAAASLSGPFVIPHCAHVAALRLPCLSDMVGATRGPHV